MNSDFEQFVLDGPIASDFEPVAYYNPDGDCCEFIAMGESFRAERLDSLVTVYIGRRSNEVIGCLIQGVSRFVREILGKYPGLKIEMQDGKVKLECLFSLRLCESYQEPDGSKVVLYKKLRDAAERINADLEIMCLTA